MSQGDKAIGSHLGEIHDNVAALQYMHNGQRDVFYEWRKKLPTVRFFPRGNSGGFMRWDPRNHSSSHSKTKQ